MNARIRTTWFSLVAAAMLSAAGSLCSFSEALGGPQPQGSAACCTATSINANGVVTAKVNATGQQFQFTLSNRAQARTLQAGQSVYANFRTKQVSLDGKNIAGSIVSITNAGVTEQRSSNAAESSGGTQSNPGPEHFEFIRTVDPCAVAKDDTSELESVASSAVSKAFPFSKNSGPYRITVYDPHVADVTCSPLHIWIDAQVRFERTDILHVETHGTTSFDSIVLGHVVSSAPPSQPITAANFKSANMCFSDIHFDTFNLKDVPSAVDNWIRAEINKKVTGKEQCRDITAMIATVLAAGGTIPP